MLSANLLVLPHSIVGHLQLMVSPCVTISVREDPPAGYRTN